MGSGVVVHVSATGTVYALSLKGTLQRCKSKTLEMTWPGLVQEDIAAAAWADWMAQAATDFEDDPAHQSKSNYFWNLATQSQRDAARQVLAIQRHFTHALQETTKVATQLGIDQLYPTFCNSDERESASLSYEAAADFLISRSTSAFNDMDRALLSYVVFDYMMTHPHHFSAGTQARTVATFTLLSVAEVRDLQQATRWLTSEDPDSPVNKFIDKSREILRFSERFPPTLDAPSCARFQNTSDLPAFNEDDQVIIRVLRRALATERYTQLPIYANLLTGIMSHLAVPQPGTQIASLNVAVLKRLGVLAPWENLVKSDPALAPWYDRLPKMPSNHVQRFLPDPEAQAVDAIRRDFGQLPVYIIDSEDASELDDGISIEPAADVGGQQTWWVHAHIADPTHALRPCDSRSFIASRRSQTAYFPEANYALLNKQLINSNKLSLGTAPEQRVLTFSSRLKEDGTVIDSSVTAGIIRNHIVTTYSKVDEVLGTPPRSTSRLLLSTFPNQSELEAALAKDDTSRTLHPLNDKAQADLKQIFALSRAHLKKRAMQGAIFWEYHTPSLKVHHAIDTPLALDSTLEKPVLYRGLPRVSASLPGFDAGLEPEDVESQILQPAGVLVSEMMIVANCAAAQYGMKHQIPLPYMGQRRPAGNESTLEVLLASRSPDSGRLPVEALLRANDVFQFPAAYTSPRAVAHWSLGVSEDVGYVRATSPLRRHLDMVVHWMLKESLVNPGSSSLRLTPELENFYAQPAGRIRRIGNRATLHWVIWVLNQEYKRWLTEGGDQHPHLERLFETLEGVVQVSPVYGSFSSEWMAAVFLPSLGISGTAFVKSPEVHPVQVGDRIPLRIRDCKRFSRLIDLRRRNAHPFRPSRLLRLPFITP